MKRNAISLCIAACISIGMIACGGKSDKDKKADNPDTATTSTPPAEPTNEPAGEKKGMTVAEAKDFLDADAANSGKEVTVSAYNWGMNERMDEKVQLNLGDEKAEGMVSASFSCMFPKSQAGILKAIEKNAMVTITGKISKGAGGVELNDCKIVQ